MTITISGAPLVAYLLASVRLVAWLVVAPPFATKAVPSLVKTLLAVGLSMAVVPDMKTVQVPTDTVALAAQALQEALIGASLGFVMFLVFSAIQAAGDLVDVFGGFQLASAFDPLSQNNNSVHGKLFGMLATMLLFATGAHLLVIGFAVSLFQSMTQIQEFTLAFVPKLIGIGVSLLLTGNWMLHTLIDYTQDLFSRLPGLLG